MMFLLLYYNQTTLGDNKIIFKTHMINIQLLNQQWKVTNKQVMKKH